MPELRIQLTSVWHTLHWPIAVLLMASTAVAVANAVRPSWSRPRLIARLAVDGFGLALTCILLSAYPWAEVTSPGIPAATAAAIEKWMNWTWFLVLVVIALVYAANAAQHARRVAGREPIRNWAMNLVAGD